MNFKIIFPSLISMSILSCDVTPELMQEQLTMLPSGVANIIVDYANPLKTAGKHIWEKINGEIVDYGNEVLDLVNRHGKRQGSEFIGNLLITGTTITLYDKLDAECKKTLQNLFTTNDFWGKCPADSPCINVRFTSPRVYNWRKQHTDFLGVHCECDFPAYLPLSILQCYKTKPLHFTFRGPYPSGNEQRARVTMPESEQKKLDEILAQYEKSIAQESQPVDNEISEDDPRYIWRMNMD